MSNILSNKLYWKQHHVIGDRFVYVSWFGGHPTNYLILPNGDNFSLEDPNGKTLGIFKTADEAKFEAKNHCENEVA